ncbi:unnamed protein product [Phytophthora lilii]|uniref:Unnamed protein product n=1 Tax=Phytophthora lilii TaxID=2077276 RepID=A0A9W6Y9I2_9STRA|nr:unnamed protein product [Phytophthora lilii]
MAWLTSAWENLPTATIASGFNRLAIPMDKREFTAQDQQLYSTGIDGLVGKLEALNVAVDVGVDVGHHD